MTRIVLLATLVGALGAAPASPRADEFVKNYGFKVEFQPGAGDAKDGTWKDVTRGAALVEITRPAGQVKLRIALRPCAPQLQCDLIAIKSNKGPLDRLVRLSAAIEDVEAVRKQLAGLDLKALPDDDCVVTITDEEQKATTFNLIDCLPTDYSSVDPDSDQSGTSVDEVDVKVDRIEPA